MSKATNEKVDEYASKIITAIGELFNEDSELDLSIDEQEMKQGDNLTHFFQALSNVVPNFYYSQITGDKKNMLEFNHMSNQLCFQYLMESKK